MNRTEPNGNTQGYGRTLFHIPLIHTQHDMGSLSESVQRVTIQVLGVKAWRHKLREIDKMWTEIEQVIEGLPLSYDKVCLYQDGLSVCGRELEIVKDLAEKGSRNHRLLLRLVEKGATLMGTESPELLREEYDLVKQVVAVRNVPSASGEESHRVCTGDTLLERRNRFIADRINSTLGTGRTGILFLGMLHSLGDLLDRDIRVIYPIRQSYHREGKAGEPGVDLPVYHGCTAGDST